METYYQMKKHVVIMLAMIVLIAMLCGCTKTVSSSESDVSNSAPNSSSIEPSQTSQTTNETILQTANAVVDVMKSADFKSLSRYVHPEKGVTFTPYSTVNFTSDRMLSNTEIENFLSDNATHQWGYFDGSGEPIDLTNKAYWDKFVWTADYSQANQVSLNKIVQTGNSIENLQDAYPSAKFVDYHFDQLEAKYEGMDWCSLKLAFEEYNGTWYLVGIIHGQWTI